jgi:hypothetical protein
MVTENNAQIMMVLDDTLQEIINMKTEHPNDIAQRLIAVGTGLLAAGLAATPLVSRADKFHEVLAALNSDEDDDFDLTAHVIAGVEDHVSTN